MALHSTGLDKINEYLAGRRTRTSRRILDIQEIRRVQLQNRVVPEAGASAKREDVLYRIAWSRRSSRRGLCTEITGRR